MWNFVKITNVILFYSSTQREIKFSPYLLIHICAKFCTRLSSEASGHMFKCKNHVSNVHINIVDINIIKDKSTRVYDIMNFPQP